MSQDSAIKERALNYLMAGATQEQTAKALGVEPSTISYLISSDSVFADAIATADLGRRQKHNKHDDLAADVEFQLLERLRDSCEGMYKPLEIARAYQIVNSGKRRGTSAPSGVTNNNQQVINISLPQAALKRIKMTAQSQIVQAGDQDLVTLQSSSVKRLLADRAADVIDTSDLLGVNHATQSLRDPSPIVSQSARAQSDTRAKQTINGTSPAEQTVRRFLAKETRGTNESAESLGFGDC